MVAKSFQALTLVGEPFQESGRMYIYVKNEKTGSTRKVRWYTETEYYKMYPDDPRGEIIKMTKTQKEIFGFDNGYVTIFSNSMDEENEFHRLSNARYCLRFGWYVVSTEPVSPDLPNGVTAIQLPWELVGNADGSLKPTIEVRQAVDRLLYADNTSEYVGDVGERLELTLTVVNTIFLECDYGKDTVHTFEDQNGNQFIWSTSAKSWEIGTEKRLRGTVKQHQTYKNIKQTVLTRCMEVK
jgi:hypothetical protein